MSDFQPQTGDSRNTGEYSLRRFSLPLWKLLRHSASSNSPWTVTLHTHLSSSLLVEGSDVERSLDREGAIAAVERLLPEVVDEAVLENYFNERGRIIDELFGGIVSFQV